ncbi:MAG: MBL fold metallo-hydrolase [Candidatus Eisenbacteria bacterium]|nr:MBL fold metallo-hydrolase [Candidatus Eisenbacteria bacterium]
MPASSAPRPMFRDAAVIVLVRGRGSGLEVFWVRRGDAVPVQPGFQAFIGGKVDGADAELPLPGVADEAERAARACAIRETLEETGVLVGVHGAADAGARAAARARLLAGGVSLAAIAREHGWSFDPAELEFAGRWRTPVFAPVRFDTLYYLARVPEGQEPEILPGELAQGEWVRPADALARWERGEVTFVAPILWSLRAIAAGEDGLAARLAEGPEVTGRPVRRIEMQHGVVMHPMRTRPLPPARHTNAYLIGVRDLTLVDPGAGEPAELEALFALAGMLEREGRRVTTVIVTHHHPDHTGGVEACRERFGARVAGHAALAPHVKLDTVLADGDLVRLSPGDPAWDLHVLATPGHTRDSLSLWRPASRALFCGDLVPGGPGSVIIDPPDGDMGQYLASLERLAALNPGTLFPAHGSPQGAAVRRIRQLIEHRRGREAKVRAALRPAPRAIAELLPEAYADTPPDLWPLAERSLLAHLQLLEREGRAAREGDLWRGAGEA